MMDKYHLTEKTAEKTIKRAEEIRSRFLSFFADKESHDDPLSYDLILNMSRLTIEKAEELVVRLISE
jgi:cytidylate kinase